MNRHEKTILPHRSSHRHFAAPRQCHEFLGAASTRWWCISHSAAPSSFCAGCQPAVSSSFPTSHQPMQPSSVMSPKLTALILAGVVSCSTAIAQVQTVTNWSTGSSPTNQFSLTNGYIAGGSSLDGQPTNAPASQQWQTTDVYNPTNGLGSSSSVQFLNGWTAGRPPGQGGNNNSVRFGGFGVDFAAYMPGITNPVLYRTFDSALTTPSDSVTFSIDFAMIGPSASLSGFYTNQDYFSFNLLNSSGTGSLAKIVFNPFASSIANGRGVNWVQNGTNVVTNGTSFSGYSINSGALFRLNATLTGPLIDMNISGLIPQSGGPGIGITNYLVTNTTTVISGGALSAGYTAADFERLDIGWELTSGSINQPGANYMIINGMSVISQAQVIPEPGTWAAAAIILIGGGAAVLRRRRQVRDQASC